MSQVSLEVLLSFGMLIVSTVSHLPGVSFGPDKGDGVSFGTSSSSKTGSIGLPLCHIMMVVAPL